MDELKSELPIYMLKQMSFSKHNKLDWWKKHESDQYFYWTTNISMEDLCWNIMLHVQLQKMEFCDWNNDNEINKVNVKKW